MKKFELFVNVWLLLGILYVAPGMTMNIREVNSDSLNFWFGGSAVISETVKTPSMEEFEKQKISKTQTEQALRSIFESP